jgi:hypothetical protein
VTGVIVVHGFDKAKVRACFDRHREPQDSVKIDGDVVLIADTPRSKNAAFTFTDATTGVFVIGPAAATRQSVERVLAGDNGVKTSSAFADSLQYVNTDASLWLMVRDGSPLVNKLNEELPQTNGLKLGTMYMSMQITDTLAIDAGLRLGSPDSVAHVVSAFQSQMADPEKRNLVNRYFDQFDVAADGSDLIVSLAMTSDQLLQLITSHVKVTGSVHVSTNSQP